MKHRIFTTIILTAVLLAGCGAEEKSEPEPAEEFEPVITITKEPTPEPTFAPIEPVKITPTAAATPAAAAEPTQEPTAEPELISDVQSDGQMSAPGKEPVVKLAATPAATPEATPEVIPEVTSEPAPEPTEEQETGMDYLGEWTATGYCPCEICCGQWAGGETASGVMPTSGHTIATGGLPFGTQLHIDGLGTYVVEDRGTDYGWVDIYFDTHQEALDFGMRTVSVYIVG